MVVGDFVGKLGTIADVLGKITLPIVVFGSGFVIRAAVALSVVVLFGNVLLE